MIIHTLQYKKETGWSEDTFPDLDSENTLVLIFAAPEFAKDDTPIKILAKHYPNSKIIGCSSAGEIYEESIYDNSLSVAIVKFEKTKLKIVCIDVKTVKNSFKAGKTAADKLESENLSGIFVLSEGLIINGTDLVEGLNTIKNKENVVITGGLAGDGSKFKKTWVIENGNIQYNKIIAVGFYGNSIHIGHGSKGGWNIFGIERRITRSKENILYELDGKSALELYKEYLGEKAAGLPATGLLFPLAIRKNLDDKRRLVRTIIGINEKEGSLRFVGDMPTGYLAQLMRANFDRIVTGAKEAGELALKIFTSDNKKKEKTPILLIAVSCVGRRLLLGERTQEETESVLKIFPKQTKMIGFYSYGELSPYSKGDCDLHNQTMTLTSFYEDD